MGPVLAFDPLLDLIGVKPPPLWLAPFRHVSAGDDSVDLGLAARLAGRCLGDLHLIFRCSPAEDSSFGRKPFGSFRWSLSPSVGIFRCVSDGDNLVDERLSTQITRGFPLKGLSAFSLEDE